MLLSYKDFNTITINVTKKTLVNLGVYTRQNIGAIYLIRH